MRTNLPVEQRIEVARRQQAARAAARLDREQARIAREMERSERQEAARRDREARSQQMLEVCKIYEYTRSHLYTYIFIQQFGLYTFYCFNLFKISYLWRYSSINFNLILHYFAMEHPIYILITLYLNFAQNFW